MNTLCLPPYSTEIRIANDSNGKDTGDDDKFDTRRALFPEFNHCIYSLLSVGGIYIIRLLYLRWDILLKEEYTLEINVTGVIGSVSAKDRTEISSDETQTKLRNDIANIIAPSKILSASSNPQICR